MAAQTLKEFLIALGFNVDERTYQKYQTAVGKVTAATAELGETAIEAVTALGYMVTRTARHYQDLYYASQRAGLSVSTFRSIQFGARQIGLSAEQATASIEGLSAALRTNVGLAALARKYVPEGEITPQKLIAGLKGQYGATPQGYMVAQSFGQMFGIDEITFKQYWDNAERAAAATKLAQEQAHRWGIDTKEVDQRFKAFNETLNAFEQTMSTAAIRMASAWAGPAKSVLKWLTDMINGFGELTRTSDAAWMALSLGVSGLGTWIGKRIIGRIWRSVAGKGATAVAAGGREAATEGIGGIAARWGLRSLGPLGALLGMTTEAGESDAAERARRERALGGGIGAGGLSPTDKDFLIRTVIGEAANQGDQGEAAVAHVIMNRLRSGRFGNSVRDIVLARNQFEPWTTRGGELLSISQDSAQYKRAQAVVDQVLSGLSLDPTGGATHFLNEDIVRARSGRLPTWAQSGGIQIGAHTFFNPNQSLPAGQGSTIVMHNKAEINVNGAGSPKETAGAVRDELANAYSSAMRNAIGVFR